jgi:hypothetical protein
VATTASVTVASMRVEIGRPVPLELSTAAPPRCVEALATRLTELGYRTDSAAKAAAFAGAVALTPPAERFSVEDLEDQLLVDHGLTVRKVRNLLDGGGFKPDRLRLELIRDLVCEANAVVLERSEARPRDARPYDVLTLVLVGPRFAVPVGWRRVWGPSDHAGRCGADWESVDRGGAIAVLTRLRSDLEELGLVTALPPLVSFDCTHGQCERLRRGVRDLGFESILELGPFYTGFESANPVESQRPHRRLHEQIPFGPGSSAPEPLLHQGLGREFVVPYQGEEPTYAMAAPGLIATPGELSGYRARARAAELGELAATIVRPEAARRLRLIDFKHLNDDGFEVAATVLSAYSSILEGRFLPPASC